MKGSDESAVWIILVRSKSISIALRAAFRCASFERSDNGKCVLKEMLFECVPREGSSRRFFGGFFEGFLSSVLFEVLRSILRNSFFLEIFLEIIVHSMLIAFTGGPLFGKGHWR